MNLYDVFKAWNHTMQLNSQRLTLTILISLEKLFIALICVRVCACIWNIEGVQNSGTHQTWNIYDTISSKNVCEIRTFMCWYEYIGLKSLENRNSIKTSNTFIYRLHYTIDTFQWYAVCIVVAFISERCKSEERDQIAAASRMILANNYEQVLISFYYMGK